MSIQRSLVFTILLSSACTIAFADSHRGGMEGKRMKHKQEALIDALELDTDREEVVRTILDEGLNARKEIRDNAKLAMKTLDDDIHAQLASVLNEEEMLLVSEAKSKRKPFEKRHMRD